MLDSHPTGRTGATESARSSRSGNRSTGGSSRRRGAKGGWDAGRCRGGEAGRFAAEALEGRVLLSTLTWANRNTFNGANDNRFDDVFGVNAAAAQGVVDAALDYWERVIVDFNDV